MNKRFERQYEDYRRQAIWDLWSEPPIAESFGDTATFFPSLDQDARVAAAERLLRELWRDGWARFVRIEDLRDEGSLGIELEDAEIEDLINSDVWRTPHLAGDALHIVLVPTQKALSWQKRLQTDFDKNSDEPS